MKDLEEIELLLEDYNKNHSDAVLLISNHLSKKKIIRAEAIIYDSTFFAIKATDGSSSFIMKTSFNSIGIIQILFKDIFFPAVCCHLWRPFRIPLAVLVYR